jgi:hypothetical protein
VSDETAVAGPGSAKRQAAIPISVAVTGHRKLSDPTALRDSVDRALEQIIIRLGNGDPGATALTIVSALAEGADRLVASRGLVRPNARLDVVLPLPPDDYREDFETAASKDEFDDLLGRAERVSVVESGSSRSEAYERAGRTIVDRCDVLVALWDGLPSKGRGGTAEIVNYARERCVPVIVIATSAPYATNTKDLPRAPRESAEAREYESLSDTDPALQAYIAEHEDWWRPQGEARFQTLQLSATAAVVQTDFARADSLALKYQSSYEWSSRLAFVAPAVAVGIVAIQSHYFPTRWPLGAAESIVLLIQSLVLVRSHRRRLHIRWISYRFLAERLRSVYFLTLAGSAEALARESHMGSLGDPTERWIGEIVDRVVQDLIEAKIHVDHVAELRDYLAEHWIDAQTVYHCRASHRYAGYDELFGRLTRALFFVAVTAAAVHTAFLFPDEHGPEWLGGALVSLSIIVPAVGAAAHGFNALREYKRHSDRSARMARRLRTLRRDMADATDAATVGAVAVAVEAVMREENSDWFGVTRFHDIELVP